MHYKSILIYSIMIGVGLLARLFHYRVSGDVSEAVSIIVAFAVPAVYVIYQELTAREYQDIKSVRQK